MNEYYQMLITGKQRSYKVHRLKNGWKLRLLFHTYKILKIYKSRNSNYAISYLNNINTTEKMKFTSELEEYLFCREVAKYSQTLINLMSSSALCLERSLAICTALRCLGVYANVVVGRRIAMNASDGFEFHAWVEANNMPINDTISTKSQFIELHRYPTS